MMFPTRLSTTLIAMPVTVCCLAATSMAGTMQASQYDFIHRNMGQTTPEARSVGQITGGYHVSGGETGFVHGSGVLVGGRYVVTAAHLVDDMTGGVFTINGQTYNLQSWVVAEDFYGFDPETGNPNTRNYSNGSDIALVQLDRRVIGARNLKAKLNRSRKEAGQTATIVGYGQGGDGEFGVGVSVGGAQLTSEITDETGAYDNGNGDVWGFQPVLRAGKNIVEPTGPLDNLDPRRNSRQLVVDFDPDPNRLGSLAALNPPQFNPFSGEYDIDEDDIPIQGEYIPAVGDSGGGLFVNGKLAGITSWSTRANSEFFSQVHFTRISTKWRFWILENIRAYNRTGQFRDILRIRDEQNVLTPNNDEDLLRVTNIFGPGLFILPDGTGLDVGQGLTTGSFIQNDLNAFPGILSNRIPSTSTVPEPTTLALLGLSGLAVFGRRRA